MKTCLDLTPRRNSNLGTLSVTERRREDQPQPSSLTAWYISERHGQGFALLAESHGCRYLVFPGSLKFARLFFLKAGLSFSRGPHTGSGPFHVFNTDTGGIRGPRVPPTPCSVNGPFDFSEDEIWDLSESGLQSQFFASLSLLRV